MKYKLFFGELDTEEGFIFDAKFLFTMQTTFGMSPEITMPLVKELLIKKYRDVLKI